jgi:hypothetical protein
MGARYFTVTFEKSIAAGASGSFSLTDAEDGAEQVEWLSADNFILWDVFTYANPGFVSLIVMPDGENTKKFRIEATQNPTRIPFMPPKLIEADLLLDYVNTGQRNDVYISFSAMRISHENYADFLDFAERTSVALPEITAQNDMMIQLLSNIQSLLGGGDTIYDFDTPYIPQAKKFSKEFCKRSK